MTTVVSRTTFRSTPHRTGGETWSAIVGLLTRGRESAAAAELRSVAGRPTRDWAPIGPVTLNPERDTLAATCSGSDQDTESKRLAA